MAFFLPLRRREPAKTQRRQSSLQVESLEDRSLLTLGYSFQSLAELGDVAPPPKGSSDTSPVYFTFDFEPGEINNRGQVAFGADLTVGGEGVFLTDAKGQLTTLARTGDPSPDGETFGPIFLGTISNNDSGESAFVFHRNGFDFPTLLSQDTALYRYTPNTGVVATLLPGDSAPGGGEFLGFNFRPSMNNGGTIAFSGLIETNIGPGGDSGLGYGIFTVDSRGKVAKVVRPGDSAPNGNTFDFAVNPWINDKGDVAFGGHVTADPFIQFGASFPAGNLIFTAESIYLWTKQHGTFTEIARQNTTTVPGDPSYKFSFAFGPQVNNRGDVAYFGAYAKAVDDVYLIPGDGGDPANNTGIFLYSGAKHIAIAKPGDSMPGGGQMISAGFFTSELGFNNNGLVTFTATLNTDDNEDGFFDTGLYAWSNNKLSLIARSGTVLPGIGTIRDLHPPGVPDFPNTFSGAANNDRGQVVFQAALTNGKGVMLLATPKGEKLVADAPYTGTESATPLTEEQLAPLVAEATARWQAAGVDTTLLSGLPVWLADLPETQLGLATENGIFIDFDGAGYSWFVDPTPGDDSEFLLPGNQGEQGKMDLLTVLMHEMGHVLGFEHDGSGLMQETLAAGTRNLPAIEPQPAMSDAPSGLATDLFFSGGNRWSLEGDAVLLSILSDLEARRKG